MNTYSFVFFPDHSNTKCSDRSDTSCCGGCLLLHSVHTHTAIGSRLSLDTRCDMRECATVQANADTFDYPLKNTL